MILSFPVTCFSMGLPLSFLISLSSSPSSFAPSPLFLPPSFHCFPIFLFLSSHSLYPFSFWASICLLCFSLLLFSSSFPVTPFPSSSTVDSLPFSCFHCKFLHSFTYRFSAYMEGCHHPLIHLTTSGPWTDCRKYHMR